MKLITELNDERLTESFKRRAVDEDWAAELLDVIYDSLRAALAERDNYRVRVRVLRKKTENMNCDLGAALARAEEAEGEACRAREAIYDAIPALKAREESDGSTDGLISIFEEVLLSEIPCRHEAALESAQTKLRGANYLIASIERLFPNWKSYRDLDDCIREAILFSTTISRLETIPHWVTRRKKADGKPEPNKAE